MSSRHVRSVVLILVLGLTLPMNTAAQSTAVLYRIFLSAPAEARTLVSYGEYARLGDRVVFSLPVGDPLESPRLQLVSIPADAVDWPATERYAHSARYANYVATRAEADFSRMSMQVAEVLNDIALSDDQGRQLRVAEEAHRQLVEWPRQNFGYRADDIRQYVTLLDEIISDLRVATGAERFSLSLMATVDPPTEPLMRPPTLEESVEQSVAAAALTTVAAERLSLLRTVVATIDERAPELPAEWASATRDAALERIADETRIERAYARLASITLARAAALASDADVRGVEGVLRSIDEEASALDGERPATLASLKLAVEERLDAARELRLARDRWMGRRKAYERYAEDGREALERLSEMEPLLDDIKALAGPDTDALDDLARRLERWLRDVRRLVPPSGMQAVHGLVTSALQFADTAVRKRQEAVGSGDIRTAWDASSAAAAAIMLRSQAVERLDRLLRMPELR